MGVAELESHFMESEKLQGLIHLGADSSAMIGADDAPGTCTKLRYTPNMRRFRNPETEKKTDLLTLWN